MMKQYTLMNQAKIENFPFSIDKLDHGKEVMVHTHDCTELVIVLSGTAMHEVDYQEYSLKAGDVFVVNTNSVHGYKAAKNFKLCNIMFELDKLLDGQNELQLVPGFQSLFILEPFFRKEHKFESKLELNLEDLNFVKELVTLLLKEYEEQKNGFKPSIRTYFSTLVAYLSRHISSDKNKASGKLFHLAEAITYMQSNFLDPLSIKDVAAIAFFSIRQFDRIFKSNYKISPKQYIIKLRLEYAVKLMNTTNFNLGTISLESGFSNISFFSRQFKIKFGIAPKEYRKNQFRHET
jgi:AraC-like DNA-binding protein